MTVQQIDDHLAAHDLVASTAPKKKVKLSAAASVTSAKSFNFCATYQKVKPVIIFARGLVALFKPTWAKAIDQFIAMADLMCATEIE